MRSILTLLLSALGLGMFAQAPSLINYQGVARNADGAPIGNKTIGIRFELQQGTGSLVSVFTETQTVTTNFLGLFTTQIGKTNPAAMSAVNFDAGNLVLKTGVDTSGGSTFIDLGTQSLVSVPFSMHAQSVPVSYTNNVLTIGKTSFTLNGSGAIYTASTGISIISNSIILNSLPDKTVSIDPGNSNINVTGTYPNFTVSSTPSLSLVAPGTLSITNGNTVDINPALSFTNNVLTVGAPSNSLLVPSITASLVGTGAIVVTTLAPNSYSVNVPVPVITQGTNVSVQGAYPNYTISAATPSLAIGGGSMSIVGSNSVALPTPNFTGTGAANVSTLSNNSYSIHVPIPVINPGTNVTVQSAYPNFTVSSATPSLTINNGSIGIIGSNTLAIPALSLSLLGPNTLSITGGNTVAIAPALSMTGNVLSVGPVSNTVTIPSGTFVATNIIQSGVLTSTQSGANFTLNVPAPTYSNGALTTGTNVINITPTMTLTGNNLAVGNVTNNVNLPVTTVTTTGVASTSSSGNNYTVNVPAPTYNVFTGSLTTGTVTTFATPTLQLSGGVLSSGPASNSVTLPAATSITTSGVASLTASGNNYTVNVPAPTYNVFTGSLTTGTVTTYATPTLQLAGNVLSSGPASNSVTLPAATNVTTSGVANLLSSGNNYTVNVPAPTYNVFTGSLTTGTVTTYATPTLQLAGNVLSSGPASNSVTLPAATSVTTSGVANLLSSGNNYTVNVPAPTYNVFTGSLTTGTVTTYATPTLQLAGNVLSSGPASNSVTLPAATSVTTSGVASLLSSGNNYTVNVPAPTYNVFTGSLTTGTVTTYATPTLQLAGNVLSSGPASNSVTLPAATSVTTSGVATLLSSGNNYTVNVPAPTYTNGALTTGTNVLNITPTMTLTGNNLAVGNTTNNVLLPVTTVTTTGAASLTSSGNNYTVDVPPTTFSNGGGMQITGVHPNYTLAAVQTLTLIGNNLSISNGNTIPLPSNTVVAITTTVTGTGAAIVTTVVASNYNIHVPIPTYTNGALSTGTNVLNITPTMTLTGNNLAVGNASNNVNLPVTTVTTSGVASVTSSGNDYTVNVPAPSYNVFTGSLTTGTVSAFVTPTLQLAGGILSSGPASNSVQLPSATTVSTSGVASLITSGNNYTVNVPAPTYNVFTGSLTTGTVSAYVTPTLQLAGGILSSGPASNSVQLPSATTVSTSGVATLLSSGNNYTVNVPASTYANGALTTGTSVINITPTMTLTGNNLAVGNTTNNVNLPVTTVTTSGVASLSSSGNDYTVNVPAPSYNVFTGSLTTGTASVYATPTLQLAGSVLSSGPASNSVTLPAATSVTTSGVATLLSSGNNYTVNVPAPSYNVFTGSLTTGTASVYATPTLQLAGSVLSSGPASNSITLPAATSVTTSGVATLLSSGNNYTVNVPAPSYANGALTTGTSVINITPTMTLTGNNLAVGNTTNNVNLPVTTVTTSGVASLSSSGNDYTVNVPAPTYNVFTGSLTTGTASVYATPTLQLAGSVLSSGPASNSITLPAATSVTTSGVATLLSSGNNYTVNVPAPSYNVFTGSLTTGTASVYATPTLQLAGSVLSSGPASNSITLPAATSVTTSGVATLLSSGNNYTVNVPAPSYNVFTGSLTTGTASVYATPTLQLAGSVLSSGPASNSITLPAATSVTTSGVATLLSSGNNYTVNVPAPSYANGALTTGTSAINITPTMTLTGNNLAVGNTTNNVNLPVTTVTTSGVASLSSSGNDYTVNVPAPTYNVFTGSLTTGTASVYATPTLQLAGSVLSSGPASNSITLPAATSVTTSGVATLLSSGNNYTVNVPAPSYNVFTGSLTTGTASVYATPTLQLAGSVLSSGPASNSITLPAATSVTTSGVATLLSSGNNYTVNVPAPSYNVFTGSLTTGTASVYATPTLQLAGSVLSSGPASNSITLPAATTVSTSGLANLLTSGNNYTVNVTPYSYTSTTGVLGSGTNTVNINPSLALSGSTLSVGASTNAINLGTLSPFTATGTSIYQNPGTTAYSVGIGTSAPSAKLDVVEGATYTGVVLKASTGNSTVTTNVVEFSSPGLGDVLRVNSTNTSTNANAAYFEGGIVSRGKTNTNSGFAMRALNQSSSDLFVVRNNGNVGIGTSVPTEELQVETAANAAISIVSGATNNSNLNFGEAGTHNMGSIRYDNTTDAMNFWTNNTSNRLVITGTGSVGIGTAAPAEKLEVVGNLRFSGALMPGGLSGTLGQLLQSAGPGVAPTWTTAGLLNGGTTNYVTKWTSATGLSSSSLIYDNGTNVGLGTATPSERLDVAGNMRFSGALMPNNAAGTSGQILQSTGLGTSPTWVVQGYNNSTGVFSTGTSTISVNPTLAFSSSAVLSSGPTSNSINFGSGTNALWTTGGNLLTNPTTNFVGTTDNVALNFRTNNLQRMQIDIAGNVGIGPLNPNVNGTTGKVLSIAATSVYVQNTAGLELTGASLNSTIPVAKIDFNSVFTAGTPTNTARIALMEPGSIFVGELAFSTHDGTTLNEAMRIDQNGNVGMGTNAPSQRLHVVGNMRFSGALMPNNTAGTSGNVLTSAGAGLPPTWTTANSLLSGTANYLPKWNAGTGLTTASQVYDNGTNVGIGTASPTYLLDIHKDATGATARVATHYTFANSGGALNLTFSRGTQAAPSAVLNADGIGWINFEGYYGSGYGVGAWIKASASENWSSTSNMGTKLEFMTRTIGSPSNLTRMAITSSGGVGIGSTYATGTAPVEGLMVQGNVGLGTQTPNAPLQFSNAIVNRKIVMFEGVNNDHQFYGFGVGPSVLRYQTDALSADHAFYAAVNSTTSNELMRILGNGNVGIGISTPANAKLHIHDGTGNYSAMHFTHNSTGPGGSDGILVGTDSGSQDMILWNWESAPTKFGTAGFERMRIDAAGNVGIGVTTVDAKLVVDGTYDLGTTNSVTGIISGAAGSNNTVTANRGTAIGHWLTVNQLGSLCMGDWSGGVSTSQMVSSTSDQFSARFGNGYRFFTDAAQTPSLGIFFSGGGNVGIGTNNPLTQLHVEKNTSGILATFDNNSTGSGTGLLATVTTASTSGGVRYGIQSEARYGSSLNYGLYSFGVGGTNGYGVYATGNYGTNYSIGLLGLATGSTGTSSTYGVYGTASGGGSSYGVYCIGNAFASGGTWNPSDRKLKDNIQPYSGALATIMKLEPKTYTYKNDEYDFMQLPKGTQIGLIAQDLEQVVPALVTNATNPGPMDPETGELSDKKVDFHAINYTGLTPILVQAMKEQQAQIEELKKLIAEQQKQIDQLLRK